MLARNAQDLYMGVDSSWVELQCSSDFLRRTSNCAKSDQTKRVRVVALQGNFSEFRSQTLLHLLLQCSLLHTSFESTIVPRPSLLVTYQSY